MKTARQIALTTLLLVASAISAKAITLPPTDDTYSFKKSGRIAGVSSKSPSLLTSPAYTTFVKFDLSGLPAMGVNAGHVRSARMRFFVLKTATRPANMNLYRVTSPWEEILTATVNQPQFDPVVAPLAQVAVNKDKSFVYADVTELVRDWMTNGNNHGVAITAQTLVRLGSKEGSATGYPAELEIETDSTLSLLTLNGNIDGSLIEAGSVGGSQIANGAIGNSQLGLGAVHGSNLGAGSVGSLQIGAGSVNGTHIAPGSITAAHLGAGAIVTSTIGDGQITETKLADGSVTFPKLRSRTAAVSSGTTGQMVHSNVLTTPAQGLTLRQEVADAQNEKLTVTLTTNGGPVFIGLQGELISTSQGLVSLSSSLTLEFERERTDVPVAPAVIYHANAGSSVAIGDANRIGIPPSSFWLLDGLDAAHPLPAGTYTYRVYVGPNSSCSVRMFGVKLVAFEL